MPEFWGQFIAKLPELVGMGAGSGMAAWKARGNHSRWERFVRALAGAIAAYFLTPLVILLLRKIGMEPSDDLVPTIGFFTGAVAMNVVGGVMNMLDGFERRPMSFLDRMISMRRAWRGSEVYGGGVPPDYGGEGVDEVVDEPEPDEEHADSDEGAENA